MPGVPARTWESGAATSRSPFTSAASATVSTAALGCCARVVSIQCHCRTELNAQAPGIAVTGPVTASLSGARDCSARSARRADASLSPRQVTTITSPATVRRRSSTAMASPEVQAPTTRAGSTWWRTNGR